MPVTTEDILQALIASLDNKPTMAKEFLNQAIQRANAQGTAPKPKSLGQQLADSVTGGFKKAAQKAATEKALELLGAGGGGEVGGGMTSVSAPMSEAPLSGAAETKATLDALGLQSVYNGGSEVSSTLAAHEGAHGLQGQLAGSGGPFLDYLPAVPGVLKSFEEGKEIGKSTRGTVKGGLTTAGAVVGSMFGPTGTTIGAYAGKAIADPLWSVMSGTASDGERALMAMGTGGFSEIAKVLYEDKDLSTEQQLLLAPVTGGLSFLYNPARKLFGSSVDTKKEEKELAWLKDQGLYHGDIKPEDRSPDQIYKDYQAQGIKDDFVGYDPKGNWVNMKFAKSRDENDLVGTDLVASSGFFKEYGKDWEMKPLEDKIKIAQTALDNDLVDEAGGYLSIDFNKLNEILNGKKG